MKKNMKKVGMIGLVGVMATTVIPTYVYNNINVKAASNHNSPFYDGSCHSVTNAGHISFDARSSAVTTAKPVDLLLITDGSGSIDAQYMYIIVHMSKAVVDSLPEGSRVMVAAYLRNESDSYQGTPTRMMSKSEAQEFFNGILNQMNNSLLRYRSDTILRQIDNYLPASGAARGQYEEIFSRNLNQGNTTSVLQITDMWFSDEDIDRSFASWAKANAKTFMSVLINGRVGTSHDRMVEVGHPNIYGTGEPTDTIQNLSSINNDIIRQFRDTATETITPKGHIEVDAPQGITLREAKLVAPDGSEESLPIRNNSVDVERDLPQDGTYKLRVEAEGLVPEDREVTMKATVGGRPVTGTIEFEGCREPVRGTDEEKENVDIPFDTTYEDTDELPAGETKVKQEGVVGTKEIKRVWKTINGEKQGNPTVTESIIKQKVDKIILRGTQQKKTVYYRILDAAGKVIKDNTKVSDGYKGAKYSVTKPTLTGYEIELKAGMQESGTLEGKDIIVDYVAYKLGQGVKARYVDETGAELKGEMLVQKAGLRNGTKYSVAPEPVLEKGGLKYIYKELKQGSAAASGVVSDNEQVVTFVYKKAEGKAVKAEFLKKDTAIKLLEDLIIKPAGTQVGTPWMSTHKNELVKDNLVYVIDGKVPVEQGKVTEMEQVLKYNYVPKLGKGVNVRYVYNNSELRPTLGLIKDGLQVGAAWGSSRVNEIVKDGLTYVLDTKNLPTESGRVTVDTQEVVYKYIPKLGKGVKVKYMAGDKVIKDELELVKDGVQVGTKWSATKVNEIEKDGLMYVLDEKSLPVENGTVTTDSQEVVYKYVPKLGKGVKVKYVAGDQAIKDELELVKDGVQVGTEWKSEQVKEIEKDGLVYELDVKNLPTESGRVTVDSQEVVYKYVPKIGQPVKVKYMSGDKEISDSEVISEGKQVGTKYEKEVAREITKDNVLYRFVGLEKLDETKAVNTEVKKGDKPKEGAPKDGEMKVDKPKAEAPKEQPKVNKEEVKPVTDGVEKDEPKVEKPRENVIELDSKSEINGMKFSGLVNNHEQVYVAKYEMVKSKTVAVTFVDEDGKEVQSKVDLVKEDQQVGTEFMYEPKEIEKDGIKYTIEKITLLGKDVKEIKGKSTEEAMLYTVHYKKVPDKKLPLPKTGSESTNAAIAFGMMLLGALGFRRYRAR